MLVSFSSTIRSFLNPNPCLVYRFSPIKVANPPRSDGHPELAQNSFNGSTTISHQVSNSNSSGSDDGRSACLHGSDDGFGGANGSDDGMFNGPDDFDKNFEKLVGNEQECASGI